MRLLFITTTAFILSFNQAKSQCDGSEPYLYLGNDTTLCSGESLLLQAPAGYDAYLWSDNSTGTSLLVNAPGTYSVDCILEVGSPNLVVNGDFQSGNSGFTSQYIPGTGGAWGTLSNPGQYAISTSPSNVHNNFNVCGDHTTGSGQMYIANGSDVANTIVWEQSITVVPNTYYNFSAWATSVENTSNPAILQFFVNNIQIGDVFSPSANGCDWSEFYDLWHSGSNTTAIISIKNQNIDGGGNDFALDDISFTSFCLSQDTIVVDFDNATASAGPDLTFCSGETAYLQASSSDVASTYLWNTGETTDSIIPENSGIYTLETTTSNGCLIQSNVEVSIETTPEASFTVSENTGIAPLEVVFVNSSLNGESYYWNFGNGEESTDFALLNHTIIFDTVDTFSVMLITTSGSCSDTIFQTVSTIFPVSLETTNVFTPNGDGINDYYQFKMENIQTLDLHILNRWGSQVYSIFEVDQVWDGKFEDNSEAPDGVYFYEFKATDAMGEKYSGHGFIHLIR
jgi:gliding motility-associated-like protein